MGAYVQLIAKFNLVSFQHGSVGMSRNIFFFEECQEMQLQWKSINITKFLPVIIVIRSTIYTIESLDVNSLNHCWMYIFY